MLREAVAQLIHQLIHLTLKQEVEDLLLMVIVEAVAVVALLVQGMQVKAISKTINLNRMVVLAMQAL